MLKNKGESRIFMKNSVIAKTLGVIFNALVYIFLTVCTVFAAFSVFTKKDADGAAELFNHQMRIVATGSMEKSELTDVSEFEIKSIPKDSMIFIELAPKDEEELDAWCSELEVGDVLTFKYVYTRQVTITHRISSIEKRDDGYLIQLIGDNAGESGEQLTQFINTADRDSPNYIIGKVKAVSVPLGVFMSLLKKPTGIILIVILPAFLILVREIIKIVGGINSERRKRELEEIKKKDKELEELRARLEELEKLNGSDKK